MVHDSSIETSDLAEIAGVPLGTVMSRLARGRKLLSQYLKKNAVGG